MAFVDKKTHLKFNKRLKKKPYIQLVKKPSKFDEKIRTKTGDLINEKPLKLDEETRRKTNHFVVLHIDGEKPPKPS